MIPKERILQKSAQGRKSAQTAKNKRVTDTMGKQGGRRSKDRRKFTQIEV
jgi:hypothetical protein